MAQREMRRFIMTIVLGLAVAGVTIWLGQAGADSRAANAAARATESSDSYGAPALTTPTPSGSSAAAATAAPAPEVGTRAPAATDDAEAAASRSSVPAIQGVRTNDGAGIEFSVTPAGASSETIDFQVSITTHAGDLSFDMAGISVLRDGQGRQVQARGWNGGKGGHHLSGKLTFPAQDASGVALLAPGTQSLELVISGAGGIPERVLAWKVG